LTFLRPVARMDNMTARTGRVRKYTDDQVRQELHRLAVCAGSYRELAEDFGIDFSYLYRMMKGERELTEEVGERAGFEMVPRPERRWVRKERGNGK
jgi:hypothetical protein